MSLFGASTAKHKNSNCGQSTANIVTVFGWIS